MLSDAISEHLFFKTFLGACLSVFRTLSVTSNNHRSFGDFLAPLNSKYICTLCIGFSIFVTGFAKTQYNDGRN